MMKRRLAMSEIKMTFGIQPEHIELIESVRDWYNNIDLPGVPKERQLDMIYSQALWNEVGKKIGWDPFTICLYYFRHLDKQKS
jgi:hypothetical protein